MSTEVQTSSESLERILLAYLKDSIAAVHCVGSDIF